MNPMSKIDKIFSCATVEEEKIKYLLDANQESKKGKDKFFKSLGFFMDNPNQFVDAMLNHPKTAHLTGEKNTDWGRKFVFVCEIETPSGKNICIKSVWQIDEGKKTPRLITAYPEKNLNGPTLFCPA